MASTILGSLWESSLMGATDSTKVQFEFMNQLGKYITSNVKFNVTFTGNLIAYPNTPIVVNDVVSLDGSVLTLTNISFKDPKGGNGLIEWSDWMSQIYSGISKTLITGPNTLPVDTITAFPTMISPSWTRDDLYSVHQSNWSNPQSAILDKLASNIMSDMRLNYVKSYPSIYMTTYTGVATINLVNTP